MPGWTELCRLDDIPPGGALGLESGLFIVLCAGAPRVYHNACPHLGVTLDWLPGRFLNADGTRIVCAMHGAMFRLEDGVCLYGPCRGEALLAVPCTVRDGAVLVQSAGDAPDREQTQAG